MIIEGNKQWKKEDKGKRQHGEQSVAVGQE